MIQIDNPIHKQIAIIVDIIGKIVYHLGQFCGLCYTEKEDLTKINPQKILIIEEEPIGDVIMSTSIFPALRQRFPSAYIAVMVGSWAKDILSNNPYINELITHDCPWAFSDLIISWKGFLSHLKYLLYYPQVLKKLKSKNFNLGIDLRGDFRNILLFIFLPKIKYSLSYSRTGGDYLLTKAVPFESSQHEVEKNFTLLTYLGIKTEDKKIRIYPSEEKDKMRVKAKLREHGVKRNDFITVIHPGAGRRVRLWPPERYAQISDFIRVKFQSRVILTGSQKDLPLVQKVADYTKEEIINLCGKLSLLELGALLKRVNLLICPDTSVMHLASAFNTSMIVLFGPRSPNETKPYLENSYIIWKKFPCCPCLQKRCKLLSEDGWSACMEAITVEDVMNTIENLMEKHKSIGKN